MNKYLRKLGFRDSDDVEMRVTIKSIRVCWIYMILFLAVWSVVSAVQTSEVPIVQVVLILTGELLYFALQWYYTRKVVREDREKHSSVTKIETDDKHKYEYVYEEKHGSDSE